MKHGDFTELAKFYVDRPGYSSVLLNCLKAYIMNTLGREIMVADVGAGTGKLTENLEEIGLGGYAVEPNDAMRQEGMNLFAGRNTFEWRAGGGRSDRASGSLCGLGVDGVFFSLDGCS